MDFHDMFPPDPNKETVTEEMHPEKAWFEEACKMKMKDLPAFMDRMLNGYNHDYGTVCRAVAACAIAAAWAASDVAGLTGFQAGFVMWDFIKNWTKSGNETGLMLVDYDNMLYPQYEERFDKTISKTTWERIQKVAKEKLEKESFVSMRVLAHWKSIVNGEVPFGYRVVDD